MKKSTRAAAVAAASAALLTVAACGGDSVAGGGESGGTSDLKLALVPFLRGDEFGITMNCGAQAAAKTLGVTVDFQAAAPADPSAQTPLLNAVGAKQPDAVLVAPVNGKAMFPAVNQLAQDGAKVVLVDSTLDDPSMAVSEVTSDNEGGGKAAAETLAELTGGGKVLLINVSPGLTTTDLRAKGFMDAVKGMSELQFIGQQYSNDDPTKAASIVTATLARHPDLKGIFATNNLTAEGAATGLRQAGKSGQVQVVGYDAGPKQVEDLEKGIVQALIAQDPAAIGKAGVEQAVASLKGETVERNVFTGVHVITKANLDQMQDKLYKPSC